MWRLLQDRAISLAKRQGHSAVGWKHVAVVIAEALQQDGATDLPASIQDLRAELPPRGESLSRPIVPEPIGHALRLVTDNAAALDLLERILNAEVPAVDDGPANGQGSGAARVSPQHPSARRALGSQIGDPPQDEQPESLQDVLAELDKLVGLDSVKQRVRDLVATHQVNLKQVELGRLAVPMSLHLVFAGDPGTGKTTVARLVARIYAALGILPDRKLHEVTRADLVGQYVGHTAVRVKEAIERSLGGVLFIDEAYALTPPGGHGADFGGEAIAELVKHMEDRRTELAVIVAGYGDEMDVFIESNPGLRGRFQTFIDFPSYSPEELLTIWKFSAQAYDIEAADTVIEAVRDHLESIRTDGQTGNARYVRGLFESMYARMSRRAAADGVIEAHEIIAFEPGDVPEPSPDAVDPEQRRVPFGF